MGFISLKLLNNDKSLIVKLGNLVVSSNNGARLLSRVLASTILGFVGALFSIFSYAFLRTVLYFSSTENCGYKCRDYFEHLSKEGPAIIYVEKSTGNLIIGQNNAARQVEIYIPSKVTDEVIISNTKQRIIKKSYRNSRKQAKEMKFSDFKKKDPVLLSFNDLE